MKRQPRKPSPMSQAEKNLIARLRAEGIELAPASMGPDEPPHWSQLALEAWEEPTSPKEPRKARPMAQWEKDLIARLKADGVEITSSTLGPDDPPYPGPIDIGTSLSDEIIRMRRE